MALILNLKGLLSTFSAYKEQTDTACARHKSD